MLEPRTNSALRGALFLRTEAALDAGIDETDVPFVFDRFYRAPSARGMPGSGLGLAIVRQVAEAHGGEVVVERPPDGGTAMRLKLPSE